MTAPQDDLYLNIKTIKNHVDDLSREALRRCKPNVATLLQSAYLTLDVAQRLADREEKT